MTQSSLIKLHGKFEWLLTMENIYSAFGCRMLCKLSSFKGGGLEGQELSSKPRKPGTIRDESETVTTVLIFNLFNLIGNMTLDILMYFVYILYVCLNLPWYQNDLVYFNLSIVVLFCWTHGEGIDVRLLYTNQSQFSAEHCVSWSKGISKHSRNLTG